MKKKKVVIIGAGLVGSLLAILLRKRNYTVEIYERRPDMRLEKMSAGKSINLALSDRGIKALELVGIMDKIKPISIPMHGRFLHHADNSTAFQPYGKEGQFINAVSRGILNCTLMDEAEAHGATIFFNEKCTHVDFEQHEIHFENSKKGRNIEIHADLIFASDGAFSAGRESHQHQHNRFQYQQYFIDYGYKELSIPAGTAGSFQLEKNALHIWPRGKYMMIALPNIDGSFTCTLFFPFEGYPSFESLDTPEKMLQFFTTTFADAVPLMPQLEEEYFSNPTASLVTVKCFPWVRNDHFALIGDAAHAIVPFFGQGMNCGFEDCTVLNDLLDKHVENWTAVLAEYQTLRKPDGDAIADLALNNFIEMRDKVADPKFILQKKIEAWFSAKHPDKWTPAYAQVTFSPHIRYSDALKNGALQDEIMQTIMQVEDIENKWDSVEIETLLLQQISNRKNV
ncbi:MAG: FAD-dependent oxidoreductase [Ferruginibacter sp.]